MTGALIILAVTVITGVVLFLTHKPDKQGSVSDRGDSPSYDILSGDETAAGEGECCGLHAVCEKVMTGEEKAVYFDDEELDRFAGQDPGTYSTDEVEEFREVLYTLRQEEVYEWGASLTLRGIALPIQLRDEWIMLSNG